MQRRTKIAVVLGVALLIAGLTVVFRKPAPATDASDTTADADLALRALATPPDALPAPRSHLTGSIEPVADNATGIMTPVAPRSDAADSPADRWPGQAESDWQRDGTDTFRATGPASSASTGAAGTSATRHKIVDGDTLSGIAERYLGAGGRYLEIYELNRGVLESPDLLPIGVELRIPAGGAPAAPSSTTFESRPMVPIPARSEAPSRPGGSARTYRVERNDTLSGIAKLFYGNANRYGELLQANRDQLSRPEDLRAGTVLVIP